MNFQNQFETTEKLVLILPCIPQRNTKQQQHSHTASSTKCCSCYFCQNQTIQGPGQTILKGSALAQAQVQGSFTKLGLPTHPTPVPQPHRTLLPFTEAFSLVISFDPELSIASAAIFPSSFRPLQGQLSRCTQCVCNLISICHKY